MLLEGPRASSLLQPFQPPPRDQRRPSQQQPCLPLLAEQLPSLLICQTRTQTRPTRSGRLRQRAATLPVSAEGIRRLPHQHC